MRTTASSLPLALAYLAYPLVMLAGSFLAGSPFQTVPADSAALAWPPRNWIDPVWAALGAAGLAALVAGGRRPGAPVRPIRKAGGLACVTALLLVLRFGSTFSLGDLAFPETAPWLMEAKPLLYLLAAGLWFLAFGPPGADAFRRCGLGLAAILLLDFGLESLAAGGPVRPFGSGEVNYDACLLLVSLAAAASGSGSDRAAPLAESVLVLGLMATFSRTGLAAGAIILLLRLNRLNRLSRPPLDQGGGGRREQRERAAIRRAALGLACLAGLWLTTLVRPVTLDAFEAMDRYWMWLQARDLFAAHPAALLAGFPPGLPLPSDAPESLAGLWSMQAEAWNLDGVHPFNFHAFWLRAGLTWGLLPPLGLALALLHRVRRLARLEQPERVGPARAPAFLSGLAVVVAVMGLSMGLFYLSNVGVPLILALASAWPGSRGTAEASPLSAS